MAVCGNRRMRDLTEGNNIFMKKSLDKFLSSGGKRLILVADDEMINRELLGMVLQEDYDVLYAENGRETLEQIREHRDFLSIVLLDLMMPEMNGLELLEILRADPELSRIPVIVLTSDQESEIRSLELGAADFIPKPYPQPGVILARVHRTIELYEDRLTIQTTERDPLTDLYNREYFFHYAELFDQYHRDTATDAAVLDIRQFHIINERMGAAFADDVLYRVAQKIRTAVESSGGIVCRREADTFLIYCPHRTDYGEIADSITESLSADESAPINIRLRIGIYAETDRELPMERRFDRAKLAADSIRTSFARNIEYYDSRLHEKELFEARLIEDFSKAIGKGEFQVFYQPKYDIRFQIPRIDSMEALVRWNHHQYGMISPGVFVPLFEENGLVPELDRFVWRTAAAQIRKWKEELSFTVPVSVNVSRVDMYDPTLSGTLLQIVEENGITAGELHLEVTESAYTQDSDQIIQTVKHLRSLGFRIEMDDFGTGYSSLGLISELPIDTLKLDMQFVKNAFNRRKDTRMLEIIIDIADYLGVPVVAEGVETAEQVNALKAIGCDLVQGYYFSKPLPADQLEPLIRESLEACSNDGGDGQPAENSSHNFGRIAHALTSGFESIYYVNAENGHYIRFHSDSREHDPEIEQSGSDFFRDARNSILQYIHPEDADLLIPYLDRESLMARLEDPHPISVTYRMELGGRTVFYNLKAVRSESRGGHHIVIGVSNVDRQIRNSGENGHEGPNPLNFAGLAQALSSDMEAIYYVDIKTDDYMEFRTSGNYSSLPIRRSGTRFFDECRENIRLVVYEADREKLSSLLKKENLLPILEQHHIVSTVYRLLIEGKPLFYRLKIVQTLREDNHHIIVGVSNIDDQITEEEKLEAKRQSRVTFAGIAKALSQDYFSIYYVDTKTDRFVEYSAHDDYRDLGIETSGEDFFNLSRKNILRVMYPEDRGRFLSVFTKENVLRSLEQDRTFTMTYRLMFNGKPNYVSMKVTRMPDEDDSHIVIGINNINAEMERRKQAVTYANISRALAADYFCIYYVDTDTGRFIEYSSDEHFGTLGIEKSGEDFFGLCRKNIPRVVHPDDAEMFLSLFTKENILNELSHQKTFTLTYRLVFGDEPTYVHMKVTHMDDGHSNHLVIGVSNIEEQMRREEEHAMALRMANRDALTGVKSKHAYLEAEEKTNRAIRDGAQEPFAVAVCDLNGLKQINDRFGHKEGDQYIKDACSLICHVFKHSPVYRIGGDEFTAILTGGDYAIREELMAQMAEKDGEVVNGRTISIACGLAVFDPDRDSTFAAVFERADALMYENKNSRR